MSKSCPHGKTALAAYLANEVPLVPGTGKVALDVGAGDGGMRGLMVAAGVLCEATWLAVEAWAPFVSEFSLKDIYDNVIVADVRYLDWGKVPPLDIAFFGNILEHMPNDDARAVVTAAAERASLLAMTFPSADRCRQAWSKGHANWFDNHAVARVNEATVREWGLPVLWWHSEGDQGLAVLEGNQ